MISFRVFTAKIGNMRKAVEWVVYPVSNDSPELRTIQSDRRIARVNTKTGTVTLSDGKGGHPGFHKLSSFAGAKDYDCPPEVIAKLKELDEVCGGPLEGPIDLLGATVKL